MKIEEDPVDNSKRLNDIKKGSQKAKSAKDLNAASLVKAIESLSHGEKSGKVHDALEATRHFFQAALKYLSPSPLRSKIHDEFERLNTYSIEEAMKIAESLEAIEGHIRDSVKESTHPDEAGVYVALAKLAKFGRWLVGGVTGTEL